MTARRKDAKVSFKTLRGKRFVVLSADAITGTFTNSEGMVEIGKQRFRIYYTDTTVEVERVSATL